MGYIAIIDTGIDDSSPAYLHVKKQYVLEKNEKSIRFYEQRARDFIGHGTEIANLIVKENPKAQLFIIKAFNQYLSTVEELAATLNFLYKQEDIDFINLSCGITNISNINELKKICEKFLLKNTILISAFDNNGALSFPASFNSVIGIDVTKTKKNTNEKFQKNSIINFFLKDKYYRVLGLNNKKEIVSGTSYACAEMTGKFSLRYNTHKKRKKLLKIIKNSNIKNELPTLKFKINKAIVFPLNKESDCIIRQKEYLSFKIIGVYDEIRKCRIGEVINGIKIQEFSKIDWNQDFDTIILSCTDELEEITGHPYKDIIIKKAKKYSKQIYSFEKIKTNLFNYNKNIFFPKTTISDSGLCNCGKIYKSSVPTILITGTNSKQGKFTLQTSLVNYFRKNNYKTGFLATEPSAYLFDADYVFPMGYNSTVELNNNPYLYISSVNNAIQLIEEKNKDLIIAGSQSYSIQYDNSFLNQFSLNQHFFFLGIDTDIYILVVNFFDEIEYIKRTINYLNSLSDGKVFAIVLAPFSIKNTVTGIKMGIVKNTKEKIIQKKKELSKHFSIPIFEFSEIKKLGNKIIDYFGE